jgi:hypothetical protein
MTSLTEFMELREPWTLAERSSIPAAAAIRWMTGEVLRPKPGRRPNTVSGRGHFLGDTRDMSHRPGGLSRSSILVAPYLPLRTPQMVLFSFLLTQSILLTAWA